MNGTVLLRLGDEPFRLEIADSFVIIERREHQPAAAKDYRAPDGRVRNANWSRHRTIPQVSQALCLRIRLRLRELILVPPLKYFVKPSNGLPHPLCLLSGISRDCFEPAGCLSVRGLHILREFIRRCVLQLIDEVELVAKK